MQNNIIVLAATGSSLARVEKMNGLSGKVNLDTKKAKNKVV